MDVGVEAALAAVRIEIGGDGCVVLVHATDLDGAALILGSGKISSRDAMTKTHTQRLRRR